MSSKQKPTQKDKKKEGRKQEPKDRKKSLRPYEQQKRMGSITRKLHWYWIRNRILRYFCSDILMMLLAIAGWCANLEYTQLGRFAVSAGRSFVVEDLAAAEQFSMFGKTIQTALLYKVTSPGGALLLKAPFLFQLVVISITAGGLFSLQIFMLLFSYFREDRRIRNILAPINEIALKADELSRLSFSEDKYEVIEKALEKIEPSQAGEEKPLSFGDSDLSGVEAAMNNLLLRMRDGYRQQARFVNDASHELRTPIAVIQGYANMLDRWGKTDPKTLEEGISAIKNESEHMSHLVDQLLFLARGDSGKTTLKLERISICDLIQEIYEESFMIDENHRYILKLPEEVIYVTADPALLKQAVRILTDNAAKYTVAGEEIVLAAGRTENGEPYLQVQDLGIGMAESEIPHIFERFYRSDEARSSAGTGLGLSIAKWIVDKHKGHFEILSRQELGTRIRIVLPESTEPQSSVKPQ